MNWSSVKNLLIAILLAANLFLVFNIVRQERSRGYISEDKILDACEILTKRGMEVSSELVPKKKFNSYVYESSYNDDYFTLTAETLSSSKREALYTLPDGSLSITTENGAIFDCNSAFEFCYRKSNSIQNPAYTDITAEDFLKEAQANIPLANKDVKNLVKIANDILGKRNSDENEFSSKIIYSYTQKSDGKTYLYLKQLLGDYEIYSHYAVCIFEGEELCAAYGRWYFSPINKKHNTELYDQISILFTNLSVQTQNLQAAENASLYDETTNTPPDSIETEPPIHSEAKPLSFPAIKEITPCYAIYWSSDKNALYFIPAWQISHSNGQTIVYNATNNSVYSEN